MISILPKVQGIFRPGNCSILNVFRLSLLFIIIFHLHGSAVFSALFLFAKAVKELFLAHKEIIFFGWIVLWALSLSQLKHETNYVLMTFNLQSHA